MIKTIKKEWKYLLTLLGIVSLITFLIWLPSLMYGRPITYGTDLKPQWFQFYHEFDKLICNFLKNRELPFYSWDMFLGNDFYSSKGYYMIGDIYAYVGLFDWHFLSKNFFDMARNITYLKFVVSSLLFYLYLSEFNRKPLSKIICSVAYAFSGWAIFYSGQLVFLSFYSFVPLYLIGIERYLKNNEWIVFVISTTLLFSTNFYFFYTLSAFSPVYFLYRYYVLGYKTKGLLTKVLKLIGYYIVGALLSSFIWLPAVLYVLGNTRFGSASEYSLFYTYKSNLFALISALVPDYLFIYRNNPFETPSHVEREICMYVGASLALLIPQYFKLVKGLEKKLTFCVYALFLCVLTFTPIASLVHGFGDPYYRWLFVLIIFNLLLVSYVLDNINLIDKKLLNFTLLAYVIILVFSFVICMLVSKQELKDFISGAAIILIFAFVLIFSKKLIGKTNIKLLIILITLELGLSAMYNYYYDVMVQPDMTYEFFNSAETMLGSYEGELSECINYLEEGNDREFIRLYVPYESVYWYFSQNMSTFFDIKGVLTYDSTLNTSFRAMSYAVPEITESCYWIVNIKDKNLLDFLSVKYAVVSPYDQMDDNWKLIKDNYLDYYHIYANNNYRSVGNTYSQVMYKDYESVADPSIYLKNVVVVDKELEKELSNYVSDADGYIKDVEAVNNHFYGTIISDKDGFMVTSIPYEKGWKILINDSEIKYYCVNGGFVGFRINEGNSDLKMYYVPQGFKEGIVLTGVSALICIYLFVNKRLHRSKRNYQKLSNILN